MFPCYFLGNQLIVPFIVTQEKYNYWEYIIFMEILEQNITANYETNYNFGGAKYLDSGDDRNKTIFCLHFL